VLNGHGGRIDTMHVALRRLQPRYSNRLLTAAFYWELAEKELAGLARGPGKVMGHDCEFETSLVLALRPELVREGEIHHDLEAEGAVFRGLFTAEDTKQRTDHGAVGYPEQASAESGRALAATGRRIDDGSNFHQRM
jgi:creatinine amidohydrolase